MSLKNLDTASVFHGAGSDPNGQAELNTLTHLAKFSPLWHHLMLETRDFYMTEIFIVHRCVTENETFLRNVTRECRNTMHQAYVTRQNQLDESKKVLLLTRELHLHCTKLPADEMSQIFAHLIVIWWPL
jgi:hypothetical protein